MMASRRSRGTWGSRPSARVGEPVEVEEPGERQVGRHDEGRGHERGPGLVGAPPHPAEHRADRARPRRGTTRTCARRGPPRRRAA